MRKKKKENIAICKGCNKEQIIKEDVYCNDCFWEFNIGYSTSKEYFEECLKTDRLHSEGAPYRIFIEVVAEAIREGKEINLDKINALDLMLKYSETPFMRGVHKYLKEVAIHIQK